MPDSVRDKTMNNNFPMPLEYSHITDYIMQQENNAYLSLINYDKRVPISI